MPEELNNWICLTIPRGTTKYYEVKFSKNGASEDITGYTIFFTLKESMKDPDSSALIQKDITSHEDAVNGISAIELSAEDTNIEPGTYWFDIQYKDNENPANKKLLQIGRIKITETVTQRN